MEEQHHSNVAMLIAVLFAALVFGGLGYWLGTTQIDTETDNTTNTVTTAPTTTTNTPSTQATTSLRSASLDILQNAIDPSKGDAIIQSIIGMEGDFIAVYASGSDGNGGSQMVIKNINNKWTLIWKGQELACSAVDEYQIPSSFYSSCYENDFKTLRNGSGFYHVY